MKRLISVILIALIICSVLPHAALGDTVSQHTVEADRVLIYNPLPYAENGNMLYSGTLPKPEDEEALRCKEAIMGRIDYWHTTMPFLGTRKIAAQLRGGSAPI